MSNLENGNPTNLDGDVGSPREAGLKYGMRLNASNSDPDFKYQDTSQNYYRQPDGYEYANHPGGPYQSDSMQACSEQDLNVQNAKPKSFLRNLFSIVLTIVLILVCARLLNMFVMQSYTIPSGSMEDTIMIGDLVFAEKVTYNFDGPKQGQIITFTEPGYNDGGDQRILIKRVIATEGQTVDLRDGYVYINGVKQDEPYTDGKPTYPLSGSAITYPYTVPEDEVWVMGDNRTNSQDSRYFGSIPNEDVIGHALFVYWPLSNLSWL